MIGSDALGIEVAVDEARTGSAGVRFDLDDFSDLDFFDFFCGG
jgi:hypothetical protein